MKILGIDVGGSGIKGAVIETRTGKMLTERLRVDTPSPSSPEKVAKTVAGLARSFDWKGPVGCGFPAVIQNGVVRTASNIDNAWIGTDAKTLLSDATGCDVTVINDADAAGLAECKFGAGKGRKGPILVITIGTGLGSAVIYRDQLLPNTEFGHVLLEGMAAEDYAADSVRKKEHLSWKKWAKRFDEYLNHMEFLLWPELIILGGGASKKLDKFGDKLTTRTEVVAAQLLNHAGIIGAALGAQAERPPRGRRPAAKTKSAP